MTPQTPSPFAAGGTSAAGERTAELTRAGGSAPGLATTGARLAVYRDGWTNGLQLVLEQGNGGYRLKGPKFNGSGRLLLMHEITERDAVEIRRALDVAFPP